MNLKNIIKKTKLLIRDPREFCRTASRSIRPVPQPYRRNFRMNLRQWLLYHHKNVVFTKTSWMGVRTLKNPFDAWIYQEIIYEVKPDVIIEIGSAEGGSTLYFANLLDIICKGRVLSIEIDRSNYKVRHDRIVELTGDCLAPETIRKAADLCRNKTVMAIHDGDHNKGHVLEDLRAYSSLVSVGSYFIVEDGIVDLFRPGDGIRGAYRDGPLAAVEEFLKENRSFVADTARERYLLTYNPKGFLRRVC